ncbi:hypothetical protein Tco_1079870 [Tanacetum coccineum]|uniref:Retrovirus-related Pol polyprotein from transposon TNT 1-94-like beta-barrel domain-containing protein n=1 Tax=Tanacetum coccineum TaxID=301880 RepID=A0ABQ5HTN5_9ASTR
MSQPANDDFSQHLSDDEESNHEDASDTGAAPKQQQQVIPQITVISNIKLPILKKEEYDIWAMKMEHYLEYIDNEVWKVIQNGNSKKRISTGKDGIVRVLSPVTAAEIQAVEKERKAKNILLMAIPKNIIKKIHEWDDAKEIRKPSETRFGWARKDTDRFQQLLHNWKLMVPKTNPEIAHFIYCDLYNNYEYLHSLQLLQLNVPEKDVLDADIEEIDINSKSNIAIRNEEVLSENRIEIIRVDGKNTSNGTHDGEKKRDSFYQHQEAWKQEKNQMGFAKQWKKGPQKPEISVSDDNSSEHSTCQSNDSEGSCGNTSKHSFETESESISVPNEMSTAENVVSEVQEVEPSCAKHGRLHFKQKKKSLFWSLSHLIKDCDYYEKKMAREAEVKRVVNTGNGVAKPVWTNANRINHSNKSVPRSVQLNADRPKFNSVMPYINTGRTNINYVRPKVNAVNSNINTVRSRQPVPNKTLNSLSPKRPQMNQINQRRDFSKPHSSVRRPFAKTTAQMSHSNAVMGNWGSTVKTSASYNWRNSRPNFNYNSGPTFIRTEHPLKNMVDRGIFDSGCSGHMTGNKDQLEDFEEFNGGSVTFGGSKGYISGKGKISSDVFKQLLHKLISY